MKKKDGKFTCIISLLKKIFRKKFKVFYKFADSADKFSCFHNVAVFTHVYVYVFLCLHLCIYVYFICVIYVCMCICCGVGVLQFFNSEF